MTPKMLCRSATPSGSMAARAHPRHHHLDAVAPLPRRTRCRRSPSAYRHPTAHAITSHCARRCPLPWFLTFDKPETLSDNDVRLLRSETHPRKCQKGQILCPIRAQWDTATDCWRWRRLTTPPPRPGPYRDRRSLPEHGADRAVPLGPHLDPLGPLVGQPHEQRHAVGMPFSSV